MTDNKNSFESNVKRLEEIISLLDKGEAPLDECLSLFEEGVKLSNDCIDLLNTAEQKIKILTEGEGGTIIEKDFVTEAE